MSFSILDIHQQKQCHLRNNKNINAEFNNKVAFTFMKLYYMKLQTSLIIFKKTS